MRCDSPPESEDEARSSVEVVEADVLEERQPPVDLAEHAAGDRGALRVEVEPARNASRGHAHAQGATRPGSTGRRARTRRASGRSRPPPHAGHSR